MNLNLKVDNPQKVENKDFIAVVDKDQIVFLKNNDIHVLIFDIDSNDKIND